MAPPQFDFYNPEITVLTVRLFFEEAKIAERKFIDWDNSKACFGKQEVALATYLYFLNTVKKISYARLADRYPVTIGQLTGYFDRHREEVEQDLRNKQNLFEHKKPNELKFKPIKKDAIDEKNAPSQRLKDQIDKARSYAVVRQGKYKWKIDLDKLVIWMTIFGHSDYKISEALNRARKKNSHYRISRDKVKALYERCLDHKYSSIKPKDIRARRANFISKADTGAVLIS